MNILVTKIATYLILGAIFLTTEARIMYIVELNVLINGKEEVMQILVEPLDNNYMTKLPSDILLSNITFMEFKKTKLWCQNDKNVYCECDLDMQYVNKTHDDTVFSWKISSNEFNSYSIKPVESLIREVITYSINVSETHCMHHYFSQPQMCFLESFNAEFLRAGNIGQNITFVVHECEKSYQSSAYICVCNSSYVKDSCSLVGKIHFSNENGTAIEKEIHRRDHNLSNLDDIFISLPRQLIRSCSNNSQNSKRWNFLQDPHSLKVIDFIFSIISLLSLFMTIFVFATCPELRNLHGKNLMALAITLFFSQILFLHDSGVANDHLCAAIGGCLHYCWLSVFTWTSVMAYDMASTFHLNISLKPHQNRESNKRFIIHAVVAWGVPAMIVIMCLLANLNIESFENLYGTIVDGGICMISRDTAIYGLFLPFGLSLVFNVSCFAVIIHGIEKKKKSHQRLNSTSNYDKTRCFIYAKISFLLGISWIICLAATVSNSREVWFTFSIMTNIQGVGIFLSFVLLNRRVRNMVKKEFRRSTELDVGCLSATNKAFRDIQRRQESAFCDADGLDSSRPSTPYDSVIMEESDKGSPNPKRK